MRTSLNIIWIIGVLLMLTSFSIINRQNVPIYFPEYGIEIRSASIGDTIKFVKSDKETFRIVFYNPKGRCYFEKYLNGKLHQKGAYNESLDTLKRYVSGRDIDGEQSIITVQSYFEPLKNGVWVTYSKKGSNKQIYVNGIPK